MYNKIYPYSCTVLWVLLRTNGNFRTEKTQEQQIKNPHGMDPTAKWKWPKKEGVNLNTDQ